MFTASPGRPMKGGAIIGNCASSTASKSASEATSRWSSKGNSPDTGHSTSAKSLEKGAPLPDKARAGLQRIHQPLRSISGQWRLSAA
jgi:hypothetical protein